MSNTSIRQDLHDRGVRLRPNRQDGTPIRWKYPHSNHFMSVPIDDYTKKLHDVVVDHPHLSEAEKTSLDNNFVYAVAEIRNDDYVDGGEQPEYLPYTDITIQEFCVLYANESGNYKLISDPTKLFKLVQVPVMFNYNGESQLIKLFGKGYDAPYWTYETHQYAFDNLLNKA